MMQRRKDAAAKAVKTRRAWTEYREKRLEALDEILKAYASQPDHINPAVRAAIERAIAVTRDDQPE